MMKFLRICLLLYLAETIILPPQLFATEELDIYTAKEEAEKVADKNVNKTCWFGGGFFMNLLAVGAALIWSSSPDPAALAGKSPEYIRAYINAYNSRTKRIQITYSSLGCTLSTTLVVGALILSEDFRKEACGDPLTNCFESTCLEGSDGTEETSSCGEGSGSGGN
jgi:hypothetical protein